MKFMTGLFLFFLLSGFVFAEEIVRDEKWQQNFKKWQQLPEERRNQLKQKFSELKKMTPEQREEFHRKAERFGNFPEGKKKDLRKKFEFLQSLSQEQREQIFRFLRFYHQLPFQKKRMLNQRLLRMRELSPEQRELELQKSPIWPKLNEAQRDAMRKFLLSEKSRTILKGPKGSGQPRSRRHSLKSKRIS